MNLWVHFISIWWLATYCPQPLPKLKLSVHISKREATNGNTALFGQIPMYNHYPVCACMLGHFSRVQLWNHMDWNLPGSSVQGFSRQEYWSGSPCPPPGDLPDQGTYISCTADRFFTTEPPGKTNRYPNGLQNRNITDVSPSVINFLLWLLQLSLTFQSLWDPSPQYPQIFRALEKQNQWNVYRDLF